MRAKEIEVSIQKLIRIVVAIVSLIVLIISAWIIIDNFKDEAATEKLLYNYTTNNSTDYRVYLKPNKFYDTKYIDKGKKYLTSIIDYIDVNFNYNFTTSLPTDNSYSYGIKAIIHSSYDSSGNSAELWSKSYDILPIKAFKVDKSSGFQIVEHFKLDYNMYNNLAKKFRDEYTVLADTTLSVVLTINSNSKLPDAKKYNKETQKIVLDLPLNKSVTDVTITGNDPLSKSITETIMVEKKVNMPLLVVAIILAIVCLPVAIISFYKLFTITNISQYLLEQRKILRNFGDIIVEVTSKPSLSGLKINNVKKFEDLINVEEELRIPILFYESQHENKSYFSIATDTQAYIYVLKSHDEEKLDNANDVENNAEAEVKNEAESNEVNLFGEYNIDNANDVENSSEAEVKNETESSEINLFGEYNSIINNDINEDIELIDDENVDVNVENINNHSDGIEYLYTGNDINNSKIENSNSISLEKNSVKKSNNNHKNKYKNKYHKNKYHKNNHSE